MSMEDDLYNVGENGEILDDENDENDENEHSEMDLDTSRHNTNENDHHGGDVDMNDEGNEEDADDDEDEDEDEDDNENENENDNENDENENEENENDENGDNDDMDSGDNGPDESRDAINNENRSKVPENGESRRSEEPISNVDGRNQRSGATNGGNSPQKPQEKNPTEPPAAKIDSVAIRTRAREAVQKATEFDIVPVVAVPYANQCHSVALSEGPKWLLTGGEDGFIRKYDFAASIEGKAPLTVAQKHNLMDNITKAGVIGSYWENEQPLTKREILNENPKFRDSDFTTGFASYEPKVNPVYSLAVERNGLWCLSGLLSGGISLYTMIYNEGAIHHYFRPEKQKQAQPSLTGGHLDAVSVLRLNHDQTAFLSGLWDKTIREWDLHTGKTKSLYRGSTGQISSVQFRPVGLTDLTFDQTQTDVQSDVDSLFGSDEEDEAGGDTANGTASDTANDASNDVSDSVRASPSTNKPVSEDKIFMSSSIDGAINIWDARVSNSSPAIRLGVPDETPPWCMTASWSNDGDRIYVGRRNSTVEEFSLRMPHHNKNGQVMAPNVLKRLMFPKISGPVSSLSVMPNDNFLFCGSNDNIRLYNLNLYDEFTHDTATAKKRATPFYVIPGHHGGVLSNLVVDETGRFLISTSGNRGWGHSAYADVVLIYSIDTEASQQ